ncbi:hypothetical protein F5Y09DRAFT_293404 [Xylaria sp. FL1042]|nr:hypothetical protein F5Y09DRAFT_336711 [Xylaria sp. FL1042]KAI0435357.1 hypothetical protein F5Y09DRAFT_293404 [Xylaria sp. FL1042]
MCGPDLFLGVIAILFPPLAVWVKCGLCSADSIINLLLCCLGYIPGLLHAWYIIAKFPDTDEYERVPQDYEHGYHTNSGGERVTYVIVPTPQPHPDYNAAQSQQQAKHSQPPVNYGTAAAASSTSHPSHQNEAGGSSSNGGGNHDRAPPTYAEAVEGDNKIQSDE